LSLFLVIVFFFPNDDLDILLVFTVSEHWLRRDGSLLDILKIEEETASLFLWLSHFASSLKVPVIREKIRGQGRSSGGRPKEELISARAEGGLGHNRRREMGAWRAEDRRSEGGDRS
jgi:hypothetical protein